ncbi:MAG: efflux transporter outer membrane subunit [Caulobacteraceae bacterium]
MEHAIAVLTGQPPAALTIAPAAAFTLTTPDVPVEVPATLLQRRPDIATAERQVAAANAQIGVQVAAYFPSVTLNGQGTASSSSVGSLFNAGNTFWSLGANVAETLLDFGARKARVAEARAAYDQTVAQYRQTTLAAFQDVEDALAADRVLGQETPFRAQASQAADRAEQIANNQYRAGTADYTTVVVAQASALSARVSLLTNQSARIAAAIDLITAMGGGWTGLPPGLPSPPPRPKS